MNKEIFIKINNEQFKIKQSFKALMLFEELTGKPINETKDSVTTIIKMFYCIVKANNNCTYSFDEFVNLLDENPDSIEVFSEYLTSLQDTEQPKKKPKKN